MLKCVRFLYMSWSPEKPHNELPPLPPSADLETIAVLKALVNARAEVSGLDEALVSLPNPRVFVNSLALLVAQASSEIGNIVNTNNEVFHSATNEADTNPQT